ncbi:acyl-CoA dehydrogenase family protein [Streptomyces sparsogenes]|uniref:Putative acyl-CoA dehydrogenase n=1 Tax=Streptomyces sparsogenes DSM 40356 TaxID=1331668 RepID=A0A1R1SKB2_9ACTN|nr:acyl-CoA dehydrogenase family protein [Streptomyces sparsogenes]OMI38712.1 putative acyl-CoA dehydrogenase [Streptomyces sparsogenes DSM 40356]
MDFTPTVEQRAARELAAEIFGDLSTHERLSALGTAMDAELWKALCAAGLPAAVEEIGLVGLVLLLEEQGRTTAQVPLAATCAYGVLPVAVHGTAEQRDRLLPALRDGTAVATGAFGSRVATARRTADGWRLSGIFPAVPWLRVATHVLVPAQVAGAGPEQVAGAGPEQAAEASTVQVAGAGSGAGAGRGAPAGPRAEPRCFLAEVRAAGIEAVETTAPWAAGRLTLDAAPAEPLGGERTHADVLGRARTAFAGLQVGVCEGSLDRVVHHTSVREQFGRPLSTHQGVLMRAADAHMDTEAIRVTAYEAAWRYDQGLPAAIHALTTAWWACEAGKRVVHSGQHLHGGIGADVEHPVHRHFLWGRQLDAYLGPAPGLLAELGDELTTDELTAGEFTGDEFTGDGPTADELPGAALTADEPGEPGELSGDAPLGGALAAGELPEVAG